MGTYLKSFINHAAYLADKDNLPSPCVSYCIAQEEAHFKPYIDPCASRIIETTYEYVDLGLPSNKLWATKNIGALTETEWGQLFSWGGKNGYDNEQVTGTCGTHAFSWHDYEFANGGSGESNMTKYNTSDGKTVLEPSDDAARFNMGNSWRMPTSDEYTELINNTTSSWTTIDGINGRLLKSKTNSNEIFFPAAGYYIDGHPYVVNNYGYYWTSSLYTDITNRAYRMNLGSGGISVGYDYRRNGFPIRGIYIGQ